MHLYRYDMLCFEGISLMLNIFRGKQTSPNYRLVPPPGGELEVLTCHESVSNYMWSKSSASLRRLTDDESPSLCVRSDTPQCQIHASEI